MDSAAKKDSVGGDAVADVLAQLERLSRERVQHHKDRITIEYRAWTDEWREEWRRALSTVTDGKLDAEQLSRKCRQSVEDLLILHHDLQSKVELASIDSFTQEAESYLVDLHSREVTSWTTLTSPLLVLVAQPLKGWTTKTKYRNAQQLIADIVNIVEDEQLGIDGMCKDSLAANRQCAIDEIESVDPRAVFNLIKLKLKDAERTCSKQLVKTWEAEMQSIRNILNEVFAQLERTHCRRRRFVTERVSQWKRTAIQLIESRGRNLQVLAEELSKRLLKPPSTLSNISDAPLGTTFSQGDFEGHQMVMQISSNKINNKVTSTSCGTLTLDRNDNRNSIPISENDQEFRSSNHSSNDQGDWNCKTEKPELNVGVQIKPFEDRCVVASAISSSAVREETPDGTLDGQCQGAKALNANRNAGTPKSSRSNKSSKASKESKSLKRKDSESESSSGTSEYSSEDDDEYEDKKGDRNHIPANVASRAASAKRTGAKSQQQTTPVKQRSIATRAVSDRHVPSVHSQYDPKEKINVWSRPEAFPEKGPYGVDQLVNPWYRPELPEGQQKNVGKPTGAAKSQGNMRGDKENVAKFKTLRRYNYEGGDSSASSIVNDRAGDRRWKKGAGENTPKTKKNGGFSCSACCSRCLKFICPCFALDKSNDPVAVQRTPSPSWSKRKPYVNL